MGRSIAGYMEKNCEGQRTMEIGEAYATGQTNETSCNTKTYVIRIVNVGIKAILFYLVIPTNSYIYLLFRYLALGE
jgi:hypothetical protein